MATGHAAWWALTAALAAVAMPVSASECRLKTVSESFWTTTSGCLAVPSESDQPEGERLSIYYEVSRPAGGSQGNLIVFHGGPGYPAAHLQDSGPLWTGLRSHFTMLYFHQRGCGHSARIVDPEVPAADPDRYSLDAIVADSRLLREALLDDRPVVLMGKSAGGFLALKYALAFPEDVASLVLAATAAHHGYVSGREAVRRAFDDALDQRYPGLADARLAAAEWLRPYDLLAKLPLAEKLDRNRLLEAVAFDLAYTLRGQFELVAMLRELSENRHDLLLRRIDAGARTLRSNGLESPLLLNHISCRELHLGRFSPDSCRYAKPGEGFDLLPALAGIKAPMLILSGRYDPILPPDYQAEIAAGTGGQVRWEVLELSAHMLFREQPQASARIILDFLGLPTQQPAQGIAP